MTAERDAWHSARPLEKNENCIYYTSSLELPLSGRLFGRRRKDLTRAQKEFYRRPNARIRRKRPGRGQAKSDGQRPHSHSRPTSPRTIVGLAGVDAGNRGRSFRAIASQLVPHRAGNILARERSLFCLRVIVDSGGCIGFVCCVADVQGLTSNCMQTRMVSRLGS
jgi:hypothetical protein